MRRKLQDPKSKPQRSAQFQLKEASDSGSSYGYREANGISWQVDEPDTPAARHPFDLEERTARFGEDIIRFLKKVSRGPHHDRLIDQLTGCGTSIGANYCEANEGLSKKDFRNIIGRCKKESKETKFFLRMIATAEPVLAPETRTLYREAKELHLIFCSIYKNTRLDQPSPHQ